jgi:hypothetical protein
MPNTEQKITKVVDGVNPTIEATVEQVGSQGALIIKSVSGSVSIADSKYSTNHLDDYTTTSVTYVGQEDSGGTWKIIKIDESGNFPVFTYASVTNNPTLTDYSTAWAGRVSATYNIFETAF